MGSPRGEKERGSYLLGVAPRDEEQLGGGPAGAAARFPYLATGVFGAQVIAERDGRTPCRWTKAGGCAPTRS